MPDIRKLKVKFSETFISQNPTMNEINAHLDFCANEDIEKEIEREEPCQT